MSAFNTFGIEIRARDLASKTFQTVAVQSKKLAKTINNSNRIVEKTSMAASKATQRMAKEISFVGKTAALATVPLRKFQRALFAPIKFLTSIRTAAFAVTTRMLLDIAKAIKEVVKEGARLEVTFNAFKSILGVSEKGALRFARTIEQVALGTLSFSESMQLANRALSSNVINLEQLATAVEFITKKAAVTGVSTAQAVNTVITGLIRGSTLRLDDFGVLVKGVEGVKRDFEAIHGIGSFEFLDSAAQKAEIINQAIAEMKEQMNAFGVSGEETFFTFGKIEASVKNIFEGLAGFLAQTSAVRETASKVADVLGKWAKNIRENGPALTALMDQLIDQVQDKWNAAIETVAAGYNAIKRDIGIILEFARSITNELKAWKKAFDESTAGKLFGWVSDRVGDVTGDIAKGIKWVNDVAVSEDVSRQGAAYATTESGQTVRVPNYDPTGRQRFRGGRQNEGFGHFLGALSAPGFGSGGSRVATAAEKEKAKRMVEAYQRMVPSSTGGRVSAIPNAAVGGTGQINPAINEAIRDFNAFNAGLTEKAKGRSGSSGGYGFGATFAGRQHGGPVSPNKPVVVGEKGPETFWPKVAGNILKFGRAAGFRNPISEMKRRQHEKEVAAGLAGTEGGGIMDTVGRMAQVAAEGTGVEKRQLSILEVIAKAVQITANAVKNPKFVEAKAPPRLNLTPDRIFNARNVARFQQERTNRIRTRNTGQVPPSVIAGIDAQIADIEASGVLKGGSAAKQARAELEKEFGLAAGASLKRGFRDKSSPQERRFAKQLKERTAAKRKQIVSTRKIAEAQRQKLLGRKRALRGAAGNPQLGAALQQRFFAEDLFEQAQATNNPAEINRLIGQAVGQVEQLQRNPVVSAESDQARLQAMLGQMQAYREANVFAPHAAAVARSKQRHTMPTSQVIGQGLTQFSQRNLEEMGPASQRLMKILIQWAAAMDATNGALGQIDEKIEAGAR